MRASPSRPSKDSLAAAPRHPPDALEPGSTSSGARSSRRSRPPNRQAAFTLIEILLAVGIFAIVLLAVHAVFHVALRLRNRTVESIESDLPVQRALSILRRDLAGIVPPGGTFGGPLESNPSIQGTMLSESPVLQFHSAVGVLSDDWPWGDIQRVAYTLTSPTNNASQGLDLVRSVTRNLLPVSQEIVETQRILGGIETLTFSFHDGTGWQPTWDSTNEVTLLPRAIKLEIQRSPSDPTRRSDRPDPIEMVVGLLVEPSTNTTDSGSSTSTDSSQGGGA
ncbi:MAG: type II secretion system protein GspJ [Limisphaerales bacterium]